MPEMPLLSVGGAHLPLHCCTQCQGRHWQDKRVSKVRKKQQPKKSCTGMKPLSEYKWENLQGSVTEKIICNCQVCIVSGGFSSFKDGDKMGYRAVVNNILVHREENDLIHNIRQNKGNDNGLQKKSPPPTSVPFTWIAIIMGTEVERVDSHKFVGFHVTSNLGWSVNPTAMTKNAQNNFYFIDHCLAIQAYRE